LIFGEGAQVLASSQYVLPKVLEQFGYQFVHKSLESALNEEFKPSTTTVQDFSKLSDELWNQNLNNHKSHLPQPTYCLKSKSIANRGKNEVFDFFSSPSNLGLATPQWMNFRILETQTPILKGSEFIYQINIGPIPLKWKSEIIHWDQDNEFVDLQIKGPYKLWWHRHKLTEQADGTVLMEDTVLYRIPMGYLGRIAHKLLIQNILKRIFNYRNKIIKLRFTQ
jgi:ligand-binding SRPBCC domain-containing protein